MLNLREYEVVRLAMKSNNRKSSMAVRQPDEHITVPSRLWDVAM